MDGIDAVIIDPNRTSSGTRIALLASLCQPLPAPLRRQIHDLSQPGDNEIARLGALDIALGRAFAAAALKVIEKAKVEPRQVRAIGSHGQTLRHHPPSSGATYPFSLQIADPNTIAEITGITTVADFRRRDIAAGGEGAPLVPAFHADAFGGSDVSRAIVNIGGIANVTLLEKGSVSGFDTGPGNTLLDQWALRHRGTAYDQGGAWAAEGQVNAALLEALLNQPYFALTGPKSTGKEAFNMPWLDSCLQRFTGISAIDVQATLAEFTAATISAGLKTAQVDGVYVCGGGAANTDLMRRLYERLTPTKLLTTADLGLHPDWVESVAFAWLAGRRLDGLSGNAPAVTGARGERILGAVFPGQGRGS